MEYVVRKPFHLDGVLQAVGAVFSQAEYDALSFDQQRYLIRRAA